MRIAHYFSNDYFKTDELVAEHVDVLEEIQLFDSSVPVKELAVLKGHTSAKLFAVSSKQVKAISLDFCELFSQSCELCVSNNDNPLYSSKCFWVNAKCQSSRNFPARNETLSQMKHCDFLQMMKTSTTSTTTTIITSTNTATTNTTLSVTNASQENLSMPDLGTSTF